MTKKQIIEEIERLMQLEDTLETNATICKKASLQPSDKLVWLSEENKHIHTWNVLAELKAKIK